MPLLGNDVIFAYLNRADPNHRTAKRIFAKLGKGLMKVEVSGVSLVEMELVYKNEGLDARLLEDLSAVAALPDVDYATYSRHCGRECLSAKLDGSLVLRLTLRGYSSEPGQEDRLLR